MKFGNSGSLKTSVSSQKWHQRNCFDTFPSCKRCLNSQLEINDVEEVWNVEFDATALLGRVQPELHKLVANKIERTFKNLQNPNI